MKAMSRAAMMLLASVLATAGCTVDQRRGALPDFSDPRDIAFSETPVRAQVNLLEYYAWLSKSSLEVKKQQYRIAQQRYETGTSAIHGLRLALVLTLSETPFTNYRRARELLAEYLTKGVEEPWSDVALATLVSDLLEKQETAKKQRAYTSKQLKIEKEQRGNIEEQRETLIEEVQKLETQVEQLKTVDDIRKQEQQQRSTLEEKVETLESQVEQLKNIEQDIRETEQSINVPAAPAQNNGRP